MTKNVNVQTTTETQTTVTTTVTTTTEYETASYVPINYKSEPGAEEFYKSNGVTVKKMISFGKERTYAIIPASMLDVPEGTTLDEEADRVTRLMDNCRKKESRQNHKVYSHETTSLNSMLESGYDPTLDVMDIALEILEKDKDTDDSDYDAESFNTNDEYDLSEGKHICRGGYNSSTDLNNPEYICAKNILYSKMYSMIGELDGEDLEIVKMIMMGASERELAKTLGIPRTTLQAHKEKLMARFRDILGKDYE